MMIRYIQYVFTVSIYVLFKYLPITRYVQYGNS